MKQQVQTGVLISVCVLGILLGLFMCVKLSAFLLLVLIAVVLSTGLDPIVQRLEHSKIRGRQLPRGLAILLVMLTFALILLLVISYLLVIAYNEARGFYYNTSLQHKLVASFIALAHRYKFIPNPATIWHRLGTQSGQFAEYLWSTTKAAFGFIGSLVSGLTVLILTFFFLNFKDGILYNLKQFIPPAHQQHVSEVAGHAAQKMGGWLRGQLTLAFIIATLIIIGVSLCGLGNYAVLIGIIGGLGELIPMVGPYLAFVPALLIAFAVGLPLWQIVLVIVFFILLAQLEGVVLAPKVMERQVGLSPVSTIIALFAGGSLLGIVGALLAIPLTAAGRIVILEAVFPAIQGKSRQEIEAASPVTAAEQQQASQPKKRKK